MSCGVRVEAVEKRGGDGTNHLGESISGGEERGGDEENLERRHDGRGKRLEFIARKRLELVERDVPDVSV